MAKMQDVGTLLKSNAYPGRGIILGKSSDGGYAVFAYFIMGRSVNSRNRVFVEKDDNLTIYPFDESKVLDPSLIIYSPVRKTGNKWVVTNGDQTDTIIDGLLAGESFATALEKRKYEPDAPNYTPRISGMLDLDNNDFRYDLSILKCGDPEADICDRYHYHYEPLNGRGHFIHTYQTEGNPLPSFSGEPVAVNISGDIDEFANTIWNSLNEENKISLYVGYIGIEDHAITTRLFNKNVK